MSLRQLNLTILADKVLEQVPRRSRSSFVSDAILAYARKKGALDKYLTVRDIKSTSTGTDTNTAAETSSNQNIEPEPPLRKKGKVNVDDGY